MSKKDLIYLDHAAATPIDKKVLAVMQVLAKYKYVKAVKEEDRGIVVELNYVDKSPIIIGMRNVLSDVEAKEKIIASGIIEKFCV